MLCLLTLSLLLLNLYFRLHQTRKISGPLAAKRKSIWIVLSIGSLTYHVLIRWPFWGGHNQLIFDLEICWQWQPIRRGNAYCSKVSIDLWDFFKVSFQKFAKWLVMINDILNRQEPACRQRDSRNCEMRHRIEWKCPPYSSSSLRRVWMISQTCTNFRYYLSPPSCCKVDVPLWIKIWQTFQLWTVSVTELHEAKQC